MKYIVKSLSLSGKGKKMFKSGDIVEQKDLESDVQELLKGGYLKQPEATEEVAEEATEEATEEVAEEVAPTNKKKKKSKK